MSFSPLRGGSAVEPCWSVARSLLALALLLAAAPGPAQQRISIDIPTEQKISCVAHRNHAVLKLAFSHDGKKLASVGTDLWLKVWDPRNLHTAGLFTFGRENYPVDVGFVPQGVAVLVTTVRPFGTPGWEVWRCDLPPEARKERLWSAAAGEAVVALWADRNIVVTSFEEQGGGRELPYGLKFLDLDSGKAKILRARAPFRVLGFSPDRKQVVLAADGKVKVLALATQKAVGGVPLADEHPRLCLLAPDNKTLVTVGRQPPRPVRFWDLASGKEKSRSLVRGLAEGPAEFTPDGRFFAVLSPTAVHIFDMKTEEFARRQQVPGGSLLCLRFAPDGQTYATGEHDGTIRIFDIPKD